MKKLKININTIILLILLMSFNHHNIFSMKKLERRYSTPKMRESKSTPGTLQEILIASGFFFLEEYILELINLYKQEEIIISQGKNILKKRKLKKWKRENIKKIQKITTQIKLLEERIDIFIKEYKSIMTQKITNIRQEEINRIALNSNESLPNLLDNLKLYLKDKSYDILEWILKTIKS